MSASRFDEAAAGWDEHPGHVARARKIAETIRAQVPVRADMVAVDYGCGTGLLTLALQPAVQRIIGVDSSPGMLAKLQEKVQARGVTNVETRLLDLAKQSPPDEVAPDLIVSAMTLHHVADIPKLLAVLHAWLRSGGYLALADLDKEDGSFHADPREVHHSGIDRAWLTAQLAEVGFEEVQAVTAHIIERPDAAGDMRRYPVFLVSGRKVG